MPSQAFNLDRNQVSRHIHLYKDYFWPDTVLYRNQFQRRFRVSRQLFMHILGMKLHDLYFQCRKDATGNIDFSSYQKCLAAIHILVYGVLA
jgi:hypothetical protein